MRSLISALVGAALSILVFTGQPAMAQRFCVPSNELLVTMKLKFKEYPRSMGIILGGMAVFIVFVTEDNSAWTMMASANGRSCFLSSGTNWMTIRMKKIKPSPH